MPEQSFNEDATNIEMTLNVGTASYMVRVPINSSMWSNLSTDQLMNIFLSQQAPELSNLSSFVMQSSPSFGDRRTLTYPNLSTLD